MFNGIWINANWEFLELKSILNWILINGIWKRIRIKILNGIWIKGIWEMSRINRKLHGTQSKIISNGILTLGISNWAWSWVF